ncbi:MAG: hypothetical protein HC936_10805 [Leptolyngbyaceae cyanobacterium SU_3_3]|nr:hypothetical protein [Leptolyngbyaceae cyanobacterium SU_3_3]
MQKQNRISIVGVSRRQKYIEAFIGFAPWETSVRQLDFCPHSQPLFPEREASKPDPGVLPGE